MVVTRSAGGAGRSYKLTTIERSQCLGDNPAQFVRREPDRNRFLRPLPLFGMDAIRTFWSRTGLAWLLGIPGCAASAMGFPHQVASADSVGRLPIGVFVAVASSSRHLSGDVRPDAPRHHVGQFGGVDIERASHVNDSLTGTDSPLHFSDLRFGPLGCPKLTSSADSLRVSRTAMTLLRNTVLDIVSHRAEEQMVRSDTRRVIALVERPETVLDSPERQFPRYATGPNVVALIPDDAVASVVDTGSPDPARSEIGANDGAILVDLCPEPIFDWPNKRGIGTGHAAKLACSLTHLPLRCQEGFRARLTYSGYRALVGHPITPQLSYIVHHLEGSYGRD